LAEREAFKTTVTNFGARVIVSVSFAILVLLLAPTIAVYACVLWGFFLLSGLSYLLARARGARPLPEICKHAGVALVVIVISKVLGLLIRVMIGSA
jgi:hypothetical protein